MAERALDAYLHVVKLGMSNKAYGQSRVLRASTVTLYGRLGVALVDVGISSESELFATLGDIANRRLVAAAIEANSATPASVQTAVDQSIGNSPEYPRRRRTRGSSGV